MGYMNPNGKDNFESLLTGNRCMSVVLGHIFQENEGLVIELKYQKDYPDDNYGKFVVYKQDGYIKIVKCNENYPHDDGQWVWLESEEDNKEEGNEL